MSENAAAYYRQRADYVGLSLPDILDGVPRLLVGQEDQFTPTVKDGFLHLVRPVEEFVLNAAWAAFERRDKVPMTFAEWQRIRQLPRYRRTRTIEQFTEQAVVPVVGSLQPPLYLEAITREEVPETAFYRATLPARDAEYAWQEPALAFLLLRNTSRFAQFVMVWAQYTQRGGTAKPSEWLTPRYLRTALFAHEKAQLPRLQL